MYTHFVFVHFSWCLIFSSISGCSLWSLNNSCCLAWTLLHDYSNSSCDDHDNLVEDRGGPGREGNKVTVAIFIGPCLLPTSCTSSIRWWSLHQFTTKKWKWTTWIVYFVEWYGSGASFSGPAIIGLYMDGKNEWTLVAGQPLQPPLKYHN